MDSKTKTPPCTCNLCTPPDGTKLRIAPDADRERPAHQLPRLVPRFAPATRDELRCSGILIENLRFCKAPMADVVLRS